MKRLLAIAIFITLGFAISYCAHASEWIEGTDADITRVLKLVIDQRAEIEGDLRKKWSWRCIDPKGCGEPVNKKETKGALA